MPGSPRTGPTPEPYGTHEVPFQRAMPPVAEVPIIVKLPPTMSSPFGVGWITFTMPSPVQPGKTQFVPFHRARLLLKGRPP